jgi:hypothetical protein
MYRSYWLENCSNIHVFKQIAPPWTFFRWKRFRFGDSSNCGWKFCSWTPIFKANPRKDMRPSIGDAGTTSLDFREHFNIVAAFFFGFTARIGRGRLGIKPVLLLLLL